MSVTVHSTAVVSPKAQLADNVSVGPFTVIEDDVVIGAGTAVASHVLIANGSRIGKECRIHHGAVLGTFPQDLKFRNEITTLEVGDFTTIREYATLNRGTHERWKTVVGSHCFMMAYSHVAHDCVVGNHVILANSVNMGGHVVIEDHAVVGGIVAIHQFSHIGCHSMIGGGFRVTKDVPPYVLAGQEPLAFTGLNLVGLKRRNFPQAVLDSLEKVYHIIYHNQLNVSQALERIKADLPMTEEVRHVVEFIEKSNRGIIWTRR
ncbi:MAG: acyl-[acyl-carrier-protein]--UDP-N-acetylglucosamine O-acyltransferase [Ignavibacteria bacterium 13_1_40CM_2_61_4]|nr:MAG: acyl-[acyl-carrier-protein]--UDP-N-acetylglucosamine O-acyltransferase [Ignavibacteria bacterium 13_1_40CM_2_61_4]